MHDRLAGVPPIIIRAKSLTAIQETLDKRPPLRLVDLRPRLPEDLHFLVHSMLKKSPRERPHADEVAASCAAIARQIETS